MCTGTKTFLNIYNTVGEKKFPLPVKIQLDCYSSDNVESEYDNQTILSPTNVKGDGIKFKKYISSKRSSLLHFNCNVYSQIMTSVLIIKPKRCNNFSNLF